MHVAYVRVSTVDQNEGRQREALSQYGIERWFSEKISAKDAERPKLQEMLDFVRDGDTLYIHDFSRLARSTRDLLDIVEKLSKKNVQLVSHHERIDSSTPSGKLMLTMLGAIYEFERSNLLERQREGIEIAKKRGVYTGGHSKQPDNVAWDAVMRRYMAREINKREAAEILHISRPTLNKLMKERKISL